MFPKVAGIRVITGRYPPGLLTNTDLEDFIEARVETLNVLNKLSEKDWQRSGRHAIFGPITLREQMAFTTEHDRVHLRQVYKELRG